MEILVCDDASTDSTRDIVRAYQAKDPRIQLLCLSENQGPGAARNLGMQAAEGEYIAFLDSDDEWSPEKLARQVERMDAEPPEVSVCFCGARIFKNEDISSPVAYVPDKAWEHDTFRRFVMGRMMFLTPTVLFRQSCLEKSGLMVPEMRRNQDAEFLLRLFCHFGIAVIPESYAVVHLVVSATNKHYDALNAALPYWLCHYELIRNKLGYWPALYYKTLRRTDLLSAAIREGRWTEASRDLWRRLWVCPLLFPKEAKILLKAFYKTGWRRGK